MSFALISAKETEAIAKLAEAKCTEVAVGKAVQLDLENERIKTVFKVKESASSSALAQGSFDSWTKGGIDLQGIRINTPIESIPIGMILFDLSLVPAPAS